MVNATNILMRRYLVILAILAAATGLPAHAQDFQWKGAIAPGHTIEIRGVNGTISAERATGNAVEVAAVKRDGWGDTAAVRVGVEQANGDVTICSIYPPSLGFIDDLLSYFFDRAGTQAPAGDCGSGGHFAMRDADVRVDYTVKVPAGVRFAGHNVNGNVEADSLASEVEARTVNGSVRVSTTEHAEVDTVNGSIDASLGDLKKPAAFHTVNGQVTVELPAAVHANLDASTINGEISTDFPMIVKGSFGRKELDGAIAGGGSALSLRTVNGSIHIVRQP